MSVTTIIRDKGNKRSNLKVANPIMLVLRAKHFNRSQYMDNCNCPVAKAAKEKFKTKDVSETPSYITVDDKFFNHEEYGWSCYLSDRLKARAKKFNNSVIRKIELIPA